MHSPYIPHKSYESLPGLAMHSTKQVGSKASHYGHCHDHILQRCFDGRIMIGKGGERGGWKKSKGMAEKVVLSTLQAFTQNCIKCIK